MILLRFNLEYDKRMLMIEGARARLSRFNQRYRPGETVGLAAEALGDIIKARFTGHKDGLGWGWKPVRPRGESPEKDPKIKAIRYKPDIEVVVAVDTPQDQIPRVYQRRRSPVPTFKVIGEVDMTVRGGFEERTTVWVPKDAQTEHMKSMLGEEGHSRTIFGIDQPERISPQKRTSQKKRAYRQKRTYSSLP